MEKSKQLYLLKCTTKRAKDGKVWTYCLARGGFVHEWDNYQVQGDAYDKAHALQRIKRESAYEQEGITKAFELVDFETYHAQAIKEIKAKNVAKLEAELMAIRKNFLKASRESRALTLGASLCYDKGRNEEADTLQEMATTSAKLAKKYCEEISAKVKQIKEIEYVD